MLQIRYIKEQKQTSHPHQAHRREATDWEKILAKDIPEKDFYPKYTKKSSNSRVKKLTNLTEKYLGQRP